MNVTGRLRARAHSIDSSEKRKKRARLDRTSSCYVKSTRVLPGLKNGVPSTGTVDVA